MNSGLYFSPLNIYSSYQHSKGSSDLGDVGLYSGLKNSITGNIDYKRSVEEADKSRLWSEYATKMQYLWNKEGLEKAGLNPYLVYNGQNGVVSGPTASTKSSGSGVGALVSLILGVTKMAMSASLNSASTAATLQKAASNKELADAINNKGFVATSAQYAKKSNAPSWIAEHLNDTHSAIMKFEKDSKDKAATVSLEDLKKFFNSLDK